MCRRNSTDTRLQFFRYICHLSLKSKNQEYKIWHPPNKRYDILIYLIDFVTFFS